MPSIFLYFHQKNLNLQRLPFYLMGKTVGHTRIIHTLIINTDMELLNYHKAEAKYFLVMPDLVSEQFMSYGCLYIR